MFFLKSFF